LFPTPALHPLFLNLLIGAALTSLLLLANPSATPAFFSFAIASFLGTFLFYARLRKTLRGRASFIVVLLTTLFFSYFVFAQKNWPILLFAQGALLFALLWAYTQKPVYIRAHPMAKGFVIGCSWASTIGLFLACSSFSIVEFVRIWFGIATWIWALSLLNDVLDMPADRNRIRSFPLVYGKRNTFLCALLLVVAAHFVLNAPVSPLPFFLGASALVFVAPSAKAHYFIEIATCLWMCACWMV
jgi:hypothetical protein